MERTDIITYYGPINAYGIGRLITITLEAISQKTSKITIRLDSEGGDLYAAFTAYEHLRSLDTVIETYNLNRIKDDALLIYLAGSERYATDEAKWLISEFSYSFGGASIGISECLSREYGNDLNREHFIKIFEARCQNRFDIRECLLEK